MVLHRPDEFFARIGRDGLIGFGESYMTGAWTPPDLAGCLTVLAAEIGDAGPGAAAAGCARWYVAGHPHDQRNSRGQHPAATSRTTTTCPTTCSRRSSTRR